MGWGVVVRFMLHRAREQKSLQEVAVGGGLSVHAWAPTHTILGAHTIGRGCPLVIWESYLTPNPALQLDSIK